MKDENLDEILTERSNMNEQSQIDSPENVSKTMSRH